MSINDQIKDGKLQYATYSAIGKPFEKQTKTIKDQEKKQVDTLKSLEFFDKQLPSIKEFISKERL